VHSSSLRRRLAGVPYGSKQPPVVKPVDPAECRHFQILHVAPGPLAMDQFGFVEAVDHLSEDIVIRVPDALGAKNRQCLRCHREDEA